jgi:hypothetical protein
MAFGAGLLAQDEGKISILISTLYLMIIARLCNNSAQPLAASVQSNRKRNFEKANNEYRTRNNECRIKDTLQD